MQRSALRLRRFKTLTKTVLKIFCKFSVFSLKSQMFFSITRTFFSESRSEQFWKQNTNLFKGWKIIFCFLWQSLVRHTWYLLTLQKLEISRNCSKYGLKIANHKTLSLIIDLMTDIRLSKSWFWMSWIKLQLLISIWAVLFYFILFYFCLFYFVLCLKLN